MHARHTSFRFVIALGLVALAYTADAKLASVGGAEASFTALGPAGLHVVGTTPDVSVSDDGQVTRVKVSLSKMTTGIALRDRHMREHLEVDKYPTAELMVPRSALRTPNGGELVSGATAAGTMTIHGRSRTVSVRYDARRDGNTIHVTGALAINMNDYGIAPPSYLHVTVKPDVQIAVHFDAVDNAP